MVLEINNLIKDYNAFKESKEVKALRGINLKVDKGEFIGIMGPSGSGKTTLLNILSGVDNATSGKVVLNDKEITNMNKNDLAKLRRKAIGYIFQDFNILDSLTVKENVALPLILDKGDPKIIEGKVDNMLKYFGINEIENKYPYNISGGQKQRVAGARALIQNPDIILADEPTGNLDSKAAKNVMEMILGINKEKNATVLMVTHDPFAASYCKRIVFIKDGQVEYEIMSNGDRNEFFSKILDTQSLIGGISK